MIDRAGLVIVASHVMSAMLGVSLGVVLTLTLLAEQPAEAEVPLTRAEKAQASDRLAATSAATSAPQSAPPEAPALAQTPPSTPPVTPALPANPTTAPRAVPVAAPAAGPLASASAATSIPGSSSSSAADPLKAKPVFLEPSPNRARYFVQSGAFVSEELARKLSARLSERGYPSEVSASVDETGRSWSVVRMIEIFATRSDAELAAGLLKRDAEVDPLIVRQLPPQPAIKPMAGASQ